MSQGAVSQGAVSQGAVSQGEVWGDQDLSRTTVLTATIAVPEPTAMEERRSPGACT